MELEDLKTAWKSIDSEIGQISKNSISKSSNDDIVLNHKNDIQTCLIKRFCWGIFAAMVGTCLLATSRIWAYAKMPVWWICAVCGLFIIGAISTILLIIKVKHINLADDTQFQVMKQILLIKKIYRNLELYGCAIVLILMTCGVFVSPIRYTTIEIVLISAVTIACFFSEYLIYKSNIKKLNKMQDWLE